MPSPYANDLYKLLGASLIAILVLLGVMVFFTPLSTLFQEGVGRSIIHTAGDQEYEPYNASKRQARLDALDFQIEQERHNLPRFPFFDRFLQKEKRFEASLSRIEIYELQWKRIEILSEMDDKVPLHKALKEYAAIIGYHQEEAKELLNQMEGK